MSRRVLINAANLHTGGGVQVAASFILELSKMLLPLGNTEFFIYASAAVDRNLRASGVEGAALPNYEVFSIHGLEALIPRNSRRFAGFDLIFTVFGPLYLPWVPTNHVVGFAQAWIIYPSNEVGDRQPLITRLLTKLKYTIQWRFFSLSDRLVVELEHVRERLGRHKRFASDRVDIVPNCLSPIYFEPSRWVPIAGIEPRLSEVCLGYVTRDYPHKNLDFLVEVSRRLTRFARRRYRFIVTLTDAEWDRRSTEFKKAITNVGPLTVAQCPTFYRAMDGMFFPSLLECFSAMPLESLVMRRPLFASDRGFVRDCCGPNTIYFNPLNSSEAAERIVTWFECTPSEMREAHLDRALEHVLALPRSEDRAKAYVRIIASQLGC